MARLRVAFVLVLAMISALSCKTVGPQGGADGSEVQAANGKGCSVYVDPSMQKAFEQADDSFKAFVLGGKSCGRANRFVGMEKMLVAAQCVPSRIRVSETAAFTADPEVVRAVDQWVCPDTVDGKLVPNQGFAPLTGNIMVSSFALLDDGFEIIAWDKKNQIHNFYTAHRGPNADKDFVFSGNSFKMTPNAPAGFAGSHPCTRCHTNGSLIMKELPPPWVNWSPGGLPKALDEEKVERSVRFKESPEKSVLAAPSLQALVENSGRLVAAQRVHRSLDEKAKLSVPPDNVNEDAVQVRDLLRPLFCENEIQLVSGDRRGATIPGDLFISRTLRVLLKAQLDDLRVAMPAWIGFFANPQNPVITPVAGSMPGFGGQPFLMPMRSIADVHVVEELIKQKVIEPKVAIAAQMIDFPNGIFSVKRCRLAQLLPPGGLAQLGTGPQLTKALQRAMQASKSPAATEFINNLSERPEAMLKRVTAYSNACASNPKAVVNDIPGLYKLIRARNQAIVNGGDFAGGLFRHAGNFAIERNLGVHLIFPEGDKLAKGQFEDEMVTGLNEACELQDQVL
jgi:hypothetical protein